MIPPRVHLHPTSFVSRTPLPQRFRLAQFLFAGLCLLASIASASPPPRKKILGMYIHQHWAYNHPYAARTWTLSDWRGYLDGISRLGFNQVLIWPMLENMPEPLTPSDTANLAKIAAVIDMAHRDFKMRVDIVYCPNVSAKNAEAAKYTFEERPFFYTDDRVDPADPVAFGKMMAWREKVFRPLVAADGIFIIDSDPGGYPGSTKLDFVYILKAHRRMLDRLRPGIEVVYWAAHGWESYGKFYSTGDVGLLGGRPEELRETIKLLAPQNIEPWGIASHKYPDLADPLGMSDRVLSLNYGAIEGEPSSPFTIYGGTKAYEGGKREAPRGAMGNSQTHCVQLPNLFAFSRGAAGLPLERKDYVAFANDLLPGHGETVVAGWEELQGSDPALMKDAAARLVAIGGAPLKTGPLAGLLFGDPARFVDDIVRQLHFATAMYEFRTATLATPSDPAIVRRTFAAFIAATERWQGKHGYRNHWRWAPMQEALRGLDSAQLNATLDTLRWVSDKGATPFDRVKNGLAELETYTPRLITAMKQTLTQLEKTDPQSSQ